MGRYVFSLAFWLAAAIGMCFATTSPSSATDPLETSGDVLWIVFASRQEVDEAIGLARRFGSEFGAPTVLSTTNGWYAVVAGPVAVPDAAAFKKRLWDAWWPPKDTFFTKGQTFIEKVWERPRSPIRTSIRLGEAVEAFGYPLTEVLAKSGNFTLGNVSALVGLGEDSRYLQISAPVQPGNSGGPLLDQSGNLVGVVSAKLNALKLMLITQGDIAQNVNFAIKASIVASFLEANGVGTATGAAAQPMQPADLADRRRQSASLSSASR